MARRLGSYHFQAMRTARLWLGFAVFFVSAAVIVVPLAFLRGWYGFGGSVLVLLLAAWSTFHALENLPDAGIMFELETRRRFREVCKEKHLAKLDIKRGRLFYPRTAELMGNAEGFTLRVYPLLGQSVADWDKASAAFALAFAAAGVRVRDNGNGSLRLSVGYQRIEAREFELGAVAELPTGVSWREYLKAVVIGSTEGGAAFALPLIDSHILIAGQTGSGKGSVIWSLVLRLVPAYRAGVVRFWAFDPKRMEMSIGRNLFGTTYAADPEAMVQLLEQAHADMQARADSLATKVRKFEPSPLHPLNVLLIDELGYLSSLLPDRKLRDRAEKALAAILVLGRAVGYVVVGALQDPRKETLNLRDLFPTRVAMRLPKSMVDLVLGAGMHELGALCDLIPPGAAGAGVAFVLSENATVPQCVRVSWCSDELIQSVAGELPPPVSVHSLPEAS